MDKWLLVLVYRLRYKLKQVELIRVMIDSNGHVLNGPHTLL